MSEQRIIRISPSGLSSIMDCSRKAYYSRVLGWESPGLKSSEAIVRGDLIHKSLELYYNNIISSLPPVENIRDSIQFLRDELEKTDLDQELKSFCIQTLMEYFAHYATDSYRPKFVEHPFSYELYEDESVKILLEGKIDLIVERTQGEETISYLVDHKTRGRTASPTLLQNQFMSYALATNIPNVIDNEIGFQTSLKPKDKFKRRILSYSEDQLDEFAEWAIFWTLSFDASVQRNHFPPNFNSCHSCHFREVCESKREFREEKLERFFTKRDKDFDIFQ